MFNEDFESVKQYQWCLAECLLLSYQSFINIYFTWNIITTIMLYKAYPMQVNLQPKWSWVISKSQKYRHSHDFWPVLLPSPLTYQSLDLWNFICCQKKEKKKYVIFQTMLLNNVLKIQYLFLYIVLFYGCAVNYFPLFWGSPLPMTITTLDECCWIKSNSDAHGDVQYAQKYCCSNGRKHLHEIVPEQFTQLGK